MSGYRTVVGLEIHCELKTFSKIFCACKSGGGAPNENTCPVCLGFPGALPAFNKKTAEYAVTAGLALNCEIERFSAFDRKNYFYPDTPKAYQITQFYRPICKNGFMNYRSGEEIKRVRINRIHLEEDAGKLLHNGDKTFVDFNRCGMPLIEIVTEPDISGAEDAAAFLAALRQILVYSGVSDCKMEEGALRVDVNLSVNREGGTLGTRTEIKNLNSFRAVSRAIKHESERQISILEGGGKVLRETRRWDEGKNMSFPMRGKEDSHDYRYMPDPDLSPVILDDEFIVAMGKKLPELPEARRARYIKFGLSVHETDVILADLAVSNFFDSCARLYKNVKLLKNYILSEILRKFRSGSDIISIKPKNFIKLLCMYEGGDISQNAAKQIFDRMWDSGGTPDGIARDLGLKMDISAEEIAAAARKLIAENPQAVADYERARQGDKGGNSKALAFFVGQLMKNFNNKANPQAASEIILAELNK